MNNNRLSEDMFRIFRPVLFRKGSSSVIFFTDGTIKASATISAISATLVGVTDEKVFLQRGQAVASISGFAFVSSETAIACYLSALF